MLSNAFQQTYFGDDFHVYRQLRRTNPSPYLFYFDFESYRLFGSSPEAQTVVKNGKVEIHPIAGTVPKTGEDEIDAEQLEFLKKDEKEKLRLERLKKKKELSMPHHAEAPKQKNKILISVKDANSSTFWCAE